MFIAWMPVCMAFPSKPQTCNTMHKCAHAWCLPTTHFWENSWYSFGRSGIMACNVCFRWAFRYSCVLAGISVAKHHWKACMFNVLGISSSAAAAASYAQCISRRERKKNGTALWPAVCTHMSCAATVKTWFASVPIAQVFWFKTPC